MEESYFSDRLERAIYLAPCLYLEDYALLDERDYYPGGTTAVQKYREVYSELLSNT